MSRTTVLIAIASTLLGLYFLGPVLTPFLAGGLIAYLGDPLVRTVMRLKMPRSVAVTVVFVVLLLLIALFLLWLLPAAGRQVNLFISKLPAILDWLQNSLTPWLAAKFGFAYSGDINGQELADKLQAGMPHMRNLLKFFISHITASTYAMVAFMFNLLLIPVVTFYLLRDWPLIIKRLRDLLPRDRESKVSDIAGECDEVIGAFFRGQLIVMLSLGGIYTLGLTFIGLDLALFIGLLAGLASIVPYLGFIVGIGTALLSAYFQFHTWQSLAWVVVVFTIGQVAESVVLTPCFVGDRIGLHPVAVIFAIMAGGQLFGFVGVLLALPVAAVIMVLLRHIRQHYIKSDFYQAQTPS